MAENRYFSFGLLSVLLHAVVIGGLFAWAFIDGCNFKEKPPEIVPFTVAIDPVGEPEVPDPEVKEPEVKEDPPKKDDVPAVVPDKSKPKPKPVEKKQPPKPKPKPKPPMVKGTRVDKPKLPQPAFDTREKQRLSDDEIRKLLNKGARIGPTTSIPKDEVSINFSIIKRELTKAWLRPSRENGGYQPAVVKFSLGPGGQITSPVLVTSSGNKVFDDSALAAVKAVGKVDGLTQRFIKNYPELAIDFSFED